MKKFLSLVLALVMTMSLVTVGAGAADFTDDSTITYEEAVDVMTALKVVGGYADGSFNPKGTLTRGAAAKIICNLILGTTTADALVADSAPYVDVPTDNVFAGYIAYLAKAGVIGGYADGTFRPAATLTGYAFMKMLLGVIGLDANVEGYTGANWSIAVAKRALSNDVDLTDGLKGDFDGTKAVTREEACLYAFNAIKANKFSYENKSTIVVGDITVSNTSEAEQGETAYYLSVFPKLNCKTDGADGKDAFGRPAHTWYAKENKDKIGTYADEPLAVYAGADFDDETLENDFEDYTGSKTIVYNGSKNVLTMSNLEESRKGYTIELYGSDDNKTINTIVVTEAYAAEITDVVTDDDDEVESVEVTVYEAGYYLNNNKTYAKIDIDVEDDEDAYDFVKGYKEDDVFMLFLKPGWDGDVDVDKYVLDAADVEAVEGEVTTLSADAGYNGWVKIDGTKYSFAYDYSQVALETESEGTFYLFNGYVVHADVEEEESSDYLMVIAADTDNGLWSKDTYYAKVVFADGTTKTIETKELASKNRAYAYKWNESKEYYELSKKVTSAELTITKGTSKIADGLYGNAKTVYVLITLDDGDVDDVDVYTSYKKVPTFTGNAAVIEDDGTVEYVFVVDGTLDTSADDMIYVAGDSVSKLTTDKDIDSDGYYTVNAIVDGAIVEIKVAANTYDGLYKSSTTSEDIYTLSGKAGKDTDYYTASSMKAASDEVVKLGNTKMAYADDVVVYVVSSKGEITKGSINKNYSYGVVYTTNDDGEVDMIIVEK